MIVTLLVPHTQCELGNSIDFGPSNIAFGEESGDPKCSPYHHEIKH